MPELPVFLHIGPAKFVLTNREMLESSAVLCTHKTQNYFYELLSGQ